MFEGPGFFLVNSVLGERGRGREGGGREEERLREMRGGSGAAPCGPAGPSEPCPAALGPASPMEITQTQSRVLAHVEVAG